MARLWRRQACPDPPQAEYTLEELSQVKLPPKEKVLAKLDTLIKDKDVHLVIKNIIEAIYNLREDSDFTKWMKTHALRYKLADKEDKMVDYVLVMTLAFVAYCKDEVYNESTLRALVGKQAKLEDLKEPACIVVAELIEALRQSYVGANISKWKLVRLARYWKKETDKIKMLWTEIENNWCKW